MQITITPQDNVLKRYSNQIATLGQKEAHKALARAVNRVTDTVFSRTVRAVAKQSSIPVAIVRRSMKKRQVRPGSGDVLEGVVWSTGKPLSLKVFGARQFKWGVKARVWGKVQRFPGTFIMAGTYRSGKPVGNGHVFHRLSSKSYPIEMMFGPSVPEEMVRDESARQFEATAGPMLEQRAAHELYRLLPK